MPKFQPSKLKVALKLCINRLKMLQSKKANLSAVARKEIAALLEKNKDESARIKVEHIIREDFLIEALELVELYCDLILARFGLIETMRYCEESIEEAVATIIWVTPRISSEVTEMLRIREQLIMKFGKEFAMAAVENNTGVVNERMIHKLNLNAPDPFLVTEYLKEIAKSRNINWTPIEERRAAAAGAGDAPTMIDTPPPGGNTSNNNNNNNNNNNGGGGNGGMAVDSLGMPVMPDMPPMPGHHAQQPYPPNVGGQTPYPNGNNAMGGNKDFNNMPQMPQMPTLPQMPPMPMPTPNNGSNSTNNNGGLSAFDDLEARFANISSGPPPNSANSASAGPPPFNASAPPPSAPWQPGPPPSVPDFDDLTARFNMLKKS